MKNNKSQIERIQDSSKSMKIMQEQHFYCFIVTKVEVNEIISDIKEEMFDGIFISLKRKNKKKSYKEQKRIVRRYAEKKAAQSVHKHIGRREGRFPKYQLEHNVGTIINHLDRHQLCF